MPGQRPRKSCKKYNVEKDSSEPRVRARGDHGSVTPLPRNSETDRRGSGSWVWKDPSNGSFTNLQAPVSTSSSTIPAAKEQQNSQDHCQDANPCEPGPRDKQIHLGTEALFHVVIKWSSLLTGTLPAQNYITQSPRNFPPHGTLGTNQTPRTCIQGQHLL